MPQKKSGVSFHPNHTKAELLKLKIVALPLRNINGVDNRTPGKRNYSGATGLSPENKVINPQKTSGEAPRKHLVIARRLPFQNILPLISGNCLFRKKNRMNEKFCVFSQNVTSLITNVDLLVEYFSENQL